MSVQLTERMKDRILDGLLVVSILLFIFGVVTPSVPQKTQDPPQSVYAPPRLAQLTVGDRPQFEELQAVEKPASQKKNSGSEIKPANTSIGTATTASATASNNTQVAAPVQPRGVVGTLNSVLKSLF